MAAKQRRNNQEVLAALKQRVRERLAEQVVARQAAVSPPPRYDELFVAGTDWLDDLARENNAPADEHEEQQLQLPLVQ